MADSDDKKDERDYVPFSVRFEKKLFESLDNRINSIPRDERPSKDGFIQQAVKEKLERVATASDEREPPEVTSVGTEGTVEDSRASEIKKTTSNERYLHQNLSAMDIIPNREKAHDKLDRLFDSGIADVAEAIDRNLTVFCLVPGVPGETDRDAAKSAGEKAGGEQHHDRVAETLRRSAGARKRKGGTVKGIRRNRRTDRGDGKKTA